MIDHLDTQTNDFLENGTRGDCIHPRTFMGDFDGRMLDAYGNERFAPPVGGRPVINMDKWESHPVTSIFDCADDVDEPAPEMPRVVSKSAESRLKESRSINDFCKAVLAVQGEGV